MQNENGRRTFEVTIETDDPDFVERLRHAVEWLAAGAPYLAADVQEWDAEREKSDALWSEVYDADAAGEG